MESIPLQIVQLSKVLEDAEKSTYQILMTDKSDVQYQTVFAVFNNYAEGTERYLSRIRGLKLRGDDVPNDAEPVAETVAGETGAVEGG